jgi:hypothetical protein
MVRLGIWGKPVFPIRIRIFRPDPNLKLPSWKLIRIRMKIVWILIKSTNGQLCPQLLTSTQHKRWKSLYTKYLQLYPYRYLGNITLIHFFLQHAVKLFCTFSNVLSPRTLVTCLLPKNLFRRGLPLLLRIRIKLTPVSGTGSSCLKIYSLTSDKNNLSIHTSVFHIHMLVLIA